MDILFLYRTPKKKRYFNQIIANSLSDEDAKAVSYYSFIFNFGFLSSLRPGLKPALERSVEEVFRSRSFFGSSLLSLIYKLLMSFKIKCLYKGLDSFLKKHSPEKVIVWNGLKHPDWVLKEVLKNHPNIKTLFMENGFLPNTTFLDSKGINAGSSLSTNAEFYRSKKIQELPQFERIEGRSSIKKISKKEKASAPLEDYLLLPFQMERDSQILDYSPWIQNMTQLFTEVKNGFENSNLAKKPMVVREHPSTKVSYPHLYKQAHELLQFDQQTPFNEALQNSSVIITVNSSVGFEGILMNKTVIVLGQAFYNIEGLCLNATNSEELVTALNNSSSFEIDQDVKSHFLSYLHNEFLVQGDWKKPSEKHFESFRKRFKNL